jgi:hypothetical protein
MAATLAADITIARPKEASLRVVWIEAMECSLRVKDQPKRCGCHEYGARLALDSVFSGFRRNLAARALRARAMQACNSAASTFAACRRRPLARPQNEPRSVSITLRGSP